jgi:hypothetical protein
MKKKIKEIKRHSKIQNQIKPNQIKYKKQNQFFHFKKTQTNFKKFFSILKYTKSNLV